jgi:hypothetical protein
MTYCSVLSYVASLALTMHEEANQFLLGLIDLDAWNAAKWKATGFVVAVGSTLTPFLVIVFTHAEPASEVFAGLRSKVGQDDEEELLRVSIVEGDFYGNPHAYAVNIGPNVENVLKHFQAEPPGQEYEHFLATSRVHHMNPSGPSQSLALFKEQFRKTGSYFLMPGRYLEGQLGPIDGLKIKKRSILFRRKEDISHGDLDTVVLE